jgi:nucleotide-binding universal stress UspA family protein
MFQPHAILHPTDFSELSRHAYPVALDLARQYGARLVLLHVTHPPRPGDISYGEIATELEPEGYLNHLVKELQEFCPPLPNVQAEGPAPGASVEYVVREGEPAHEIVTVAQAFGCDLIVITTHGRTGLNRLLLGSTAERVIRLSRCPVLAIKAPEPNAPARPT